MTFISYAQNYEDVMLFRALGDIERGFYVDVGAQDPVDDSVTKAFYERGWRGINIEPVERWHDKLRADRPHDVNLRLLVTSQPGHATLYEVADSGLSTMDRDLAMSHAASGRKVTEQQLECVALDTVLAQHAPPTIHFLKVDVEGAEREVLEGLSLQRYRPWILVIEARGLPIEYLAAHGAGWQVHVEDLAAHLAGRERCDIKARWDELIPAYQGLAPNRG